MSSARWSRRRVLSHGALGALAAGCHTVGPRVLRLPAACPALTTAEREVMTLASCKSDFALGVMAGELTHEGVMCWTRWTTQRAEISLAIRVMAIDGDQPRVVYEREVRPDEAGFVHHAVAGLRANTWHRYVFVYVRDGRAIARGPAGRFRTAPSPDSRDTVTFGGSSCTSSEFGGEFLALRYAALCNELDFFVFSGDHVYADEAQTAEQYRAVYQETFARIGLRALHESTAMIVAWDDHEVSNDWDGETVDPARLQAARRAFFEHHPWEGGWQQPRPLYQRYSWGKTLDIFVLDSRGERRPSTRLTPQAEYLSPAQCDWLIEGLARSQATWKFVVNTVPITRFGGIIALAEADRWQGYPAQRERVLAACENVKNVWWLSGDFHLGCVAKVEREGPHARMREVLMGPGGQLPSPLASLLYPPQYEFATSQTNWVRFVADPHRAVLTLEMINEEGRTLFAQRYPAQL